jgi:NADH:ubiquinone oxidoreductase subunit E
MKKRTTPYLCHIFVCSNVRDGRPDNPGCGAKGGDDLKTVLKQEIKERGWSGKVRVSTTGCMGLCSSGPNILLHPQKIHFSEVTREDLNSILETVAGHVGRAP